MSSQLMNKTLKEMKYRRKRKVKPLARALDLITCFIKPCTGACVIMVGLITSLSLVLKKPNSTGQKSHKHDCGQEFPEGKLSLPLTLLEVDCVVSCQAHYNSYGLQMEANWNYTCAYILGFTLV